MEWIKVPLEIMLLLPQDADFLGWGVFLKDCGCGSQERPQVILVRISGSDIVTGEYSCPVSISHFMPLPDAPEE
jgi:hypothetical protein